MRSFLDDGQDIKADKMNNMHGGRGANLIVAILLVLAVIVTAYYSYMKNQGADLKDFSLKKMFSSGVDAGDAEKVFRVTNTIPYESKENTAFSVYRDYIAKAGIDGIELLDKKGTVIWRDAVPMSRPVLKSNGTDLLAADVNGMDFIVINGKGEKWKGKSEGNIINADISTDGHVTILSKAKRYGGVAIVYDAIGFELFKTFISDNSPIAARISPSSGLLAVSCINTAGSRVQTHLKIYDMNGKPLAGKDIEPVGSIYPVISYAGDDLLYLAGDNSLTLLDASGEQKWTKVYDTVFSASMAGSRNIAAAVEDNKSIGLKIFGTNGRELASYDIGAEVRNLSSAGNIIAINTIREVYFVNDRGSLLGKYTSKADISDVYFFDKYEAAVVSKGKIAVVSLK